MSKTQAVSKRERKLAALRLMDLTEMGYEARTRHSRQIKEAESKLTQAQDQQQASATPVGHTAD